MFQPLRLFTRNEARQSRWALPIALLISLIPSYSRGDTVSPSRLTQNVARLASKAYKPLIVDPSLERAAARHAGEILKDPTWATPEAVRQALRREGLADAILLPFSSLGPDQRALAQTARRFAKRAQPRGMTHLGLAFAGPSAGRYALVALLSRRLVTLAPLAKRPRPEPLTVRGRALPGVSMEVFLLGPCRDDLCLDRSVARIPAERRKDLFSFDVPLDRGRGRYTVEILAERDRGPEIAALWTFDVGVRARPAQPTAAGAGNDPGALLDLIGRARNRRDLAPLARDPRLDRAAAKHARAVCRSMVAAHVLDGSDPPSRARAEGVEVPVAENVAIAPSVAAAHRNILASPSHRRNVFSPTAARIGLGVAVHEDAYCVVELFSPEEASWEGSNADAQVR